MIEKYKGMVVVIYRPTPQDVATELNQTDRYEVGGFENDTQMEEYAAENGGIIDYPA